MYVRMDKDDTVPGTFGRTAAGIRTWIYTYFVVDVASKVAARRVVCWDLITVQSAIQWSMTAWKSYEMTVET